MSVSPSDILKLGADLIDSDDEVSHRAGVSRRYYACFHLCKRLLQELERRIEQGGGSHEAMVNALRNHRATAPYEDEVILNRLASRLDLLRQARHRADYRIEQSMPAKDLQTSSSVGETIFDDVSTFSGQHAFEQCREAARR